jgi:drug/metabolite transporter (DMT)-like permease
MAVNLLLYAAASLIWGSTWLAIKLQLAPVPPILSVAYRFGLAAAILLLFCLATGRRLAFSLADHRFMALQGFTLFGLSYCLSYLATGCLTSGLVAVVFSTIQMWNILNLRLFMRQPVAWRAFWGGALGLTGIGVLFWRELFGFAATRELIGLAAAVGGAYLASLGNVVGARHARRGVPVTQANAYGMAYGGLLTAALHLATGGEVVMDWSWGYLAPMLYLTVFGSIAAFGCYMLLIGRIGAEYAAYVTLLMPVIALLLSTLFEAYRFGPAAAIGVAVVLTGNLIILTPPAALRRARRRGAPRPVD